MARIRHACVKRAKIMSSDVEGCNLHMEPTDRCWSESLLIVRGDGVTWRYSSTSRSSRRSASDSFVSSTLLWTI